MPRGWWSTLTIFIWVNILSWPLLEILLLVLVFHYTVWVIALKITMIFWVSYFDLGILCTVICYILSINKSIHLWAIVVAVVQLLLEIIAVVPSVTILTTVRSYGDWAFLVLQLEHFVVTVLWLVWERVESIVW